MPIKPYPVLPLPLPPAPKGWRAALNRMFLAGEITFAELCWMIRTRGSSTKEGR